MSPLLSEQQMAEKKAATLEAIEEAAQQDRTFFAPLSTAPQTAGLPQDAPSGEDLGYMASMGMACSVTLFGSWIRFPKASNCRMQCSTPSEHVDSRHPCSCIWSTTLLLTCRGNFWVNQPGQLSFEVQFNRGDKVKDLRTVIEKDR